MFIHIQQAFMQSNKFMKNMVGARLILPILAISARYISEQSDKSRGCIASENAANIYGLNILHKGINFNDSNTTQLLLSAVREWQRRDVRF